MTRALDFRLYLVTDRKQVAGGSLENALEKALLGGVRAVQLREKDLDIRELLDTAYSIREMTKKFGARLFINDRVDIALAVDADGVHLGHTGMPAYAARGMMPEVMFMGVSTHSVEEVMRAEQDGADFVTLGPIYETPSKIKYGTPLGLDILKEAIKMSSVPVFAIGGIKQEHIDSVVNAGASGTALISAILASKDIRSDSEKIIRKLSYYDKN
jgi:thiamine-phosphate pyrophosphorylase